MYSQLSVSEMKIQHKVFFSFRKELLILCLSPFTSEPKTCTSQLKSILNDNRNIIKKFSKAIYTMKTRFTLLTILISSILFVGCSGTKDVPETREQRVVRYLTGVGNKYWHLKEVHVNLVKQTLTDYQLKYTKTYTSDPSNSDPLNAKTGTYVNSDGLNGKWKLTSDGTELQETYLNNSGGPVKVPYSINAITETILDIEYLINMTLVREVYYAY
jgi:hypothetical protein